MTPIRRLALTTLAALFITLGTAAPIATAGRPVQVELCDWRQGNNTGPCEEV